jgi:hypothetical protein
VREPPLRALAPLPPGLPRQPPRFRIQAKFHLIDSICLHSSFIY